MSTIQQIQPLGVIQTIAVPPPAAGDSVLITHAGGPLFELLYIAGTLTAGAGGGNRRLNLQFTINSRVILTGQMHDTLPATVANDFRWEAGGHEYFDFAAVNQTYQAFPRGFILNTGDQIRITVVNIQALDQWTNVVAVTNNYPVGI